MKFIKRLSIVILVILVVAFAGIYAVSSFIDKGFVEQQISAALGREFKINGELIPQFNLSPTIKITDATLANASWGSKAPLAKIGEAEISLQIIPLLSNDVQINSLSLKSGEIMLEKKGSKWNFDFSDDTKKEEKAATEAAEEEQKLSINKINIENVRFTVKDGKTAIYDIDKLELDSGTKASDVSLIAVLDGTRVKFDGNINALTEIAESQKVKLKNFKLAALNYEIKGNLNADLSKKKPYVSGAIALGDIDLYSEAAQAEAEPEDAVAKGKELYSKEPLPFDALDTFNGDLKISIDSLKLNEKVEFANLEIPAKISGGVLTAEKISTGFDSAKILADIKVSGNASSLLLNVTDLNSANLFLDKDFSGGLTNLSADVHARGDSVYKIVNSLSGTTKFHLKDAVYSGEVKDDLLEQLFKLLAGGSSSNRAEINCVIANLDWTNGTGDLKEFGVVTDYAVVAGVGKIKLPTQKLKLILYPEAKSIGLSDFLVPPLAVSGSFDNISVYPEAKGTAISALKTAAGLATGVGIFARIGEVMADKTGISESLGLTKKNPCKAAEQAIEKTIEETSEEIAPVPAVSETGKPADEPANMAKEPDTAEDEKPTQIETQQPAEEPTPTKSESPIEKSDEDVVKDVIQNIFEKQEPVIAAPPADVEPPADSEPTTTTAE